MGSRTTWECSYSQGWLRKRNISQLICREISKKQSSVGRAYLCQTSSLTQGESWWSRQSSWPSLVPSLRVRKYFLLFLKVCCCAPVCEFAVESNRNYVRKSLVDAWQLSEILQSLQKRMVKCQKPWSAAEIYRIPHLFKPFFCTRV